MVEHLFVYGTLKRACSGAFGRSMRDRLHRESRHLGAATMAGRLFDLGSYPGVVAATATGPAEVVHGELVELLDPAASLVWLDRYEGILPGELAASEYRREQHPVKLSGSGAGSGATGVGEVMAWVYIYSRDTSAARRVVDGDWQPI